MIVIMIWNKNLQFFNISAALIIKPAGQIATMTMIILNMTDYDDGDGDDDDHHDNKENVKQKPAVL